jgi:hypothetical protein
VIREAKADLWMQFGNEVEERFGEDKRKFWSIIKNLRGKYRKKVRSVKNRENKLETEATKVLLSVATPLLGKILARRRRSQSLRNRKP